MPESQVAPRVRPARCGPRARRPAQAPSRVQGRGAESALGAWPSRRPEARGWEGLRAARSPRESGCWPHPRVPPPGEVTFTELWEWALRPLSWKAGADRVREKGLRSGILLGEVQLYLVACF
ncbi:hypothetical protein H1C71_018018 [Ictidomys tridecemlineatus]|nr:hypothetical protein H1C71_018018 [Ictidomys tridecemlineatus]KAG3263025.1 hypothetical protein H1C71_018018 [Ictidomys tridecemlineatus]